MVKPVSWLHQMILKHWPLRFVECWTIQNLGDALAMLDESA
jgi:hypothetical protein